MLCLLFVYMGIMWRSHTRISIFHQSIAWFIWWLHVNQWNGNCYIGVGIWLHDPCLAGTERCYTVLEFVWQLWHTVWFSSLFVLQEWKAGISHTRISIPPTPWHWTNISTMRSATNDAISPTSFPSPRLVSSNGMVPSTETAISSWPLCVWALCSWRTTFLQLFCTPTGASTARTGRRQCTCARLLRTLLWRWPFWKPAWSLCSSILCGTSHLVSGAWSP